MFRISPAIIIASLAGTNAVFADITATGAWESWHKQMIASGYEVSFELENSGDILTVNDLILSKDIEEGPEKTVLNFGAASFMELGNGTVEIVFANNSMLTWQTEFGTYLAFERQHQNMHYILSGTADAMKHSITADKISWVLAEMKRDGQVVEDAKINLSATDVSSQFQLSGEALQKADMSVSLSEFNYDIKIETPEPIYKNMDWSGVISGLNMSMDIAVPKNIENSSFSETMNAAFKMLADFRFDQIKNNFTLVDGEEKATALLASNGGGFSFHMAPKTEDLLDIQTKISLSDLDFSMDIINPDQDTDVSLELFANGYGLNLNVLLPENADPDKSHKSFNDGLDIQYDHKINSYSVMLRTTENGQTTTVNSEVESTNIALATNRKELRLKGQSQGAKATVETDLMPIGSVGYSFGKTAIDLQFPMGVSAKPEPFNLGLILSDVSISENLWALFDKQSLLPHDAASLELELSGLGNWLVDIMDPETKETARKGELHSLNLKTLAIMAVGAKLTGNADFSFDNNDLDTFDGIPAPSGNAHFDISGVNALIESLIKLGIMSPGDAMGARMGLSVVAIAGEQNDTLVSDITITADGDITANGKRLK